MWNSFPSGSANIAIVPYDSLVIGIVIFTPFFFSDAISFSMSLVTNMNPVFPLSGRESGHRWIRTFDPRGDTTYQCGNLLVSRNPSFSRYHFAALFSLFTTTATVANCNMAPGNPRLLISLAVYQRWGGRPPRNFARSAA